MNTKTQTIDELDDRAYCEVIYAPPAYLVKLA